MAYTLGEFKHLLANPEKWPNVDEFYPVCKQHDDATEVFIIGMSDFDPATAICRTCGRPLWEAIGQGGREVNIHALRPAQPEEPPAMVQEPQYQRRYHVNRGQYGVLITRMSDGATCFLQGDDATRAMAELENLDEIEYPVGPFKTYEEAEDEWASNFDNVMVRRA